MPRSKLIKAKQRRDDVAKQLDAIEAELRALPAPRFNDLATYAADALLLESQRTALVIEREALAKRVLEVGEQVSAQLRKLYATMDEVRTKARDVEDAMLQLGQREEVVAPNMQEQCNQEAHRNVLLQKQRRLRLALARADKRIDKIACAAAKPSGDRLTQAACLTS